MLPNMTNASVDVAIPVYNEEADLERAVRRLHAYAGAELPYDVRITIVDNASVDATWSIAQRLRDELPNVEAIRLDEKGRGRALRAAWMTSDADVVAYMDVDLSTDLRALLPLVAPLVSGHSDVAIGSRLLPASNVVRSARRELISRAYNLLVRTTLGTRFHDAQCGFKALRTEVAQRLLPRVQDQSWFFDTELLVLAQRAGLRIQEVPVDWVDDPDSRVAIVQTALEDLRGVARLVRARGSTHALDGLDDLRRRQPRNTGLPRQIRSFIGVGVLSTVAYVGLFSMLRGGLPAGAASALALLLTAFGNTAANRRLTFGVRGTGQRLRDHAGGLAAFGVALAITTGGLAALTALDHAPSRVAEDAALVGANALATAVRFLLLRATVTRSRSGRAVSGVPNVA
jgi:putative flippase GtrA